MATSSRDARRRRIVERGSDRLALITGRIQSLPSSSEPHLSHTVSSPDVFFEDQNLSPSDQTNVAPRDTGDAAASAAQLRKCETTVDALRTSALEISSSSPQPSPTPSAVPEPSKSLVDKPSPSAGSSYYHKKFTANQISHSISASEKIRIVSSISIALLVVFSHLSIPLLSSNIIKSIIATRPLYLILLTDITIVVARLLNGKKSSFKKISEEVNAEQVEDANGWEGMGQALETGMLLYEATSAAFMDCSIYAVIVICGLSLL